MSMLPNERWSDAEAYRRYIGRWSALVASEFIDWLDVPPGAHWLDIGTGAGGVTTAILEAAAPASVEAVDSSPAYVEYVRTQVADDRAVFSVDNAVTLAGRTDNSFNAVVSGLVLNFLSDPAAAVAAMVRVAKPAGVVAAYVWDYAGKMEYIRCFWDAAIDLFPEAAPLDEGVRFPDCNPEGLAGLWEQAGLQRIETRPIDVPSVFRDFDDFWLPFLGGQGPAPAFALSLTEADLTALQNAIASRLPFHTDGSIHLTARAWAVRGSVPP